MGWTSYHASHYKRGSVDRKAECDAYFLEGLNEGHYVLKKSCMVGSTYYAAVQCKRKYVGTDEDGKSLYEDVPEDKRETWAAVFLTSVDQKDYYNFSYKDLSEDMGPCEADCPAGILDLLSPTDNEWALAWRERCRENIEIKKRKRLLSSLREGSIIRFKYPYENGTYFKKGELVEMEKRCVSWSIRKGARKTYRWLAGRIYMTQTQIPDNFEVIMEA